MSLESNWWTLVQKLTNCCYCFSYIWWYHNNIKLVESPMFEMVVGQDKMSSSLTISGEGQSESGNYTCSPNKLGNDTIRVVVNVHGKIQGSLSHSQSNGTCCCLGSPRKIISHVFSLTLLPTAITCSSCWWWTGPAQLFLFLAGNQLYKL